MFSNLITKFVKTEKVHPVETTGDATWFVKSALPIFGLIKLEHKSGVEIPKTNMRINPEDSSAILVENFNVIREADDYFLVQYIPLLPDDPVASLLSAALLSIKCSPEPTPYIARISGKSADVKSLQYLAKNLIVKQPAPVSDHLIMSLIAMNDRQVQVIASLNNTNDVVNGLIKDVSLIKGMLILGTMDKVDDNFKAAAQKLVDMMHLLPEAGHAPEPPAPSVKAPKKSGAKKRSK